jgi:hypothetical protein
MYVRIGFRLSSLDVGTCARICRLGAILGSCTCTSTIRVRIRVRVRVSRFGEQGSTCTSIFWRRAWHIW